MKTGVYWLKTGSEHGFSEARLQKAAAMYLGVSGSDGRLFVKRDEGGRPYFPYAPGLHCSVSHSGGIWLCALSRAPVGVDLQRRENSDCEKIARRFFHPDEVKFLEGNGFADFFRLWAAKESYVKYTGQGMLPGFDGFSAVNGGDIAECIGGARLRELPFLPDFSLFLCGGQGETDIFEFTE